MLEEVESVKQQPGENFCRWFSDEYFDLYVWTDPSGTITGFQLCYDKPGKERAFTWFSDSGPGANCEGRCEKPPVLFGCSFLFGVQGVNFIHAESSRTTA